MPPGRGLACLREGRFAVPLVRVRWVRALSMSINIRASYIRGLFAAALTAVGLFKGDIALAQSTAPTFAAIARTSSATLAAGNPVTYTFTITPAAGDSLTFVSLFFQDALGTEKQIIQSDASLGTGSMATTTQWLNGNYTFTKVTIVTAATGRSDYSRDGSISRFNSGVTGPTTHTLSFAALDFSLSGGASNLVAPAFTAIARSSPATLAAGNPVTYIFTITPAAGDSLTFVSLFFQDALGTEKQIIQSDASLVLTCNDK